jgi:hypothetical protein
MSVSYWMRESSVPRQSSSSEDDLLISASNRLRKFAHYRPRYGSALAGINKAKQDAIAKQQMPVGSKTAQESLPIQIAMAGQ